MPTPISNYTISLVNDSTANLLCTFGGRDSAGGNILDVQCYNPLTNTASVVASLPAAWTGYNPGAQVVVNNKVYIFGGFNGSSTIAITYVYDPDTKNFNPLGNLNLARTYIMASAVDGIIYAFGGDTWNGSTLIAQTKAEKMDPAVGTWNDAGVADLPVAGDEGQAFGFASGTSFNLNNKIALVTMAQFGTSDKAVVYDIAYNTYRMEFADLIDARRICRRVYPFGYTVDKRWSTWNVGIRWMAYR
jgi:hypothetical protein